MGGGEREEGREGRDSLPEILNDSAEILMCK